MPKPKMSWQFSADVENMASIQAMSSAVDVEAVDQISVTIDPRENDKVVAIQPAEQPLTEEQPIQLLVVKPSSSARDVTFRFDDGVANHPNKSATPITLKAPQIFTQGTLQAIYQTPKFLLFTNSGDESIEVFIYVVRDATP